MNIDDLVKEFKELKDQRTAEYKEEQKYFVGGTGELRADDR